MTRKRLQTAIYNFQQKNYHIARKEFIAISKTEAYAYPAFIYLGLIAINNRNDDEAELFWDKAYKLNKNDNNLNYNLSTLKINLKKYYDAIQILKNNQFSDEKINLNLCLAYMKYGELSKAESVAIKSKKIFKTNQFDILLGNIYEKLRNNIMAEKHYRLAYSSNNGDYKNYINLIKVLLLNKKYSDAEKLINNHTFKEDDLIIHYKAKIISQKKGNKAAIEFLEKQLLIYKKSALLYEGLGLFYLDILNFSSALTNIDKGLQINPNDASLKTNLGLIFLQMGLLDKSEEAFMSAIQIDPANYLSRYNLAFLFFRKGLIKKAFEFYHYRKFILGFKNISNLTLETLKKNKQVKILAEQGIGDTILFSSVIPMLFKINPNILLYLDKRLHGIFQRSFSVDLEDIKEISNYDDATYYIGDLPSLFIKNMSDFNLVNNSYLKAKTLNIKSQNKIRIGISWESINEKIGSDKSISLDWFLNFLKNKNCQIINLQYNKRIENNDNRILNYDDIDKFNDIDGLLTIINSCDYVITISNVVAHLAGAIGKKTCLLLPPSNRISSLWYWQLKVGDKSAWYSNVEIIEIKEKNYETICSNLEFWCDKHEIF